jgi:hypothetical protein
LLIRARPRPDMPRRDSASQFWPSLGIRSKGIEPLFAVLR